MVGLEEPVGMFIPGEQVSSQLITHCAHFRYPCLMTWFLNLNVANVLDPHLTLVPVPPLV